MNLECNLPSPLRWKVAFLLSDSNSRKLCFTFLPHTPAVQRLKFRQPVSPNAPAGQTNQEVVDLDVVILGIDPPSAYRHHKDSSVDVAFQTSCESFSVMSSHHARGAEVSP